MGEVIINVQDVGVRFRQRQGAFGKRRDFWALRNLNLQIYRGENLGIVGRNGAGKTTLLRVLAGIYIPDEGRVENQGVTISLLALQAGFDTNLSGRENALFGGMLLGYSRKDVKGMLSNIQEFSGLGDFFDQPVRTYSSGMGARLGFSIVKYASPDVLLLDEVLSVGDRHFRKRAEEHMRQEFESGRTIVLVSHSDDQIKSLCSRVVKL